MAEKSPDSWRPTIRRRLTVAAVMMAAWCLVIAWRLVDLQVVQRQSLMASRYTGRSDRQTIPIPARRGDILDRNGTLLSFSVDVPSIYANVKEVGDPKHAAEVLCDALGDRETECRQTLIDRLNRKSGQVQVVKRYATLDEAHRILDLKLPGIDFELESQRVYPHLEAAAHVLGSVGPDQALGGIEAKYDKQLKGSAGTLSVQRDGHGGTFDRQVTKAPVAGTSIELTIDLPLQVLVERELQRGVQENGAAGGSVVVMDPSSGEIRALASYPTFNPNPGALWRGAVVRNPVVQDAYEPGSTMKSVTASVALEEHVVTPDELIDVSSGKIAFGNGGTDVVTDSHRYETLSFRNVIAMSSNVGTIKVAAKIGGDRLADYISRFGFGRLTSGDFLGESKGRVPDAPALRNDAALARAAIGYTLSVTPLQMAAAMSSIANGGELVRPRVVRAFIQDDVRQVVPREVLNHTVSRETTLEVTRIMEEVVERGTGTYAQIQGYTVAGKTGTAEKLIGRRYSETEHHASFAGFVPSRAPEFTIVVVIDSPSVNGPNGHFGGPVAGPIFKRIAEGALRLAAVPPTVNPLPPLLVRRDQEGVRERPTSGSTTPPPTALDAIGHRPGADGRLPDLTGMSGRPALGTLSRLGVTPHAVGSGVVVDQRPRAGTPLEAGTAVTLWLSRRRPAAPIVNDVGRP